MDFYNAYSQGFVRVAACTHHAAIGDPATNAASVLRLARQCHDDGVALAIFPELTLSGYSIEDILLQDVLLDAVEDAVLDVVTASSDLLPVLVVGAPLRYRHRIYNTAVVVHRGVVLGVVPKSYLPTYREFYERRQIAPGDDERGTIRMAGMEAPFGPDLLFAACDLPGFVLHVEICEDMFVPVPPSAEAALAGATVLANLSGSPITIGRAEDRCPLGIVAVPGRLRVRSRGGGRVDDRPGLGRPDHDLGERRTARRIRALSKRGTTLHRRRRHRADSRGAAANGDVRR
jgi:NAD+ synthase (glutamine-hydrolysing)